MAINILEMLQNAVGKDLTTHASRLLGEPEGSIGTAIQAALPALLSGVMSKASTLSGATDLLNMIKGPAVSSELLLKDLVSLFSGDETTGRLSSLGTTLLNSVFGSKLDALTSALGSMAGIRSASATGLLGMLAPLLFSFLKGQVTKSNLGAAGLMSLLGSQAQFLNGKLSDTLTGALGLGSAGAFLGSIGTKLAGVAETAGAVTGAAGLSGTGAHAHPTTSGSKASAGKRLWLWLLPLLAIPLFFLIRGCDEQAPDEPLAKTVPRTPVEQATAEPAIRPTGAGTVPTKIEQIVEPTAVPPTEVPQPTAIPTVAPTAIPTEVPAATPTPAAASSKGNGKTPAVGAPPAAKVFFEVGKAKLPGNADKVLQSIVDYASAHADAVVTVTGFHDPTGNRVKNAELAKNRALAVQRRLISLGINERRLLTKKPEVTTGSGDLAAARRVEVSIK